MSTNSTPPAPLAPPEEQFWERYSPHYEFPLSSVGAVAAHVGGVVLFSATVWLLSKMSFAEKTAPPMRVMTLVADGDGKEGQGSGGGTQQPENVDPTQQTLPRSVKNVDLAPVVEDIKPFLPKVPSTRDGLRPEDLPAVPKIAGLDDELRRKLMPGSSGNKGSGPGAGAGGPGPEGTGGGSASDPSSSQNRGIRWELNFKTESGKDYLEQLRAMKATLLIPQPSTWKDHKAYDLTAGLTGRDYDISKLPGLYFIDDEPGSASRLTRAMGLDFSPPKFLAFFPKDIEEELAKLERTYRNRKESEIFSTTFKVFVVDGKPSIRVLDQVPVRK
jgi:hypothetical protein